MVRWGGNLLLLPAMLAGPLALCSPTPLHAAIEPSPVPLHSQVTEEEHQHRGGFCATGLLRIPEATDPLGLDSRAALHSTGLPPADTLDEPTVIDVLFLYTPQAVLGEGNEEGIHHRVLLSVQDTNQVFENSKINVIINPIHIGLIAYTESGNLPEDLNRLGSGREGLQHAHTLRQDYKADLVCLIIETENQGIQGAAWDIPPPRGRPERGFTVCRRAVMGAGSNDLLLAHELGHLLGCDHDREHASLSLDHSFYLERTPYLFGHRLKVEGVTYTCLMGYEPGITLPYFSSPHLTLDEVPLGIPADQPRPSDGARVINAMAPYVANYRVALSRISFEQERLYVEEGSEALVRLVRTGDLSTSTRVGVMVDSSSTATAGLDYTPLSRPFHVIFEAGQDSAEIFIPVLADDAVEPEETLKLKLFAVAGNHGLGERASMEVHILDRNTDPSDWSHAWITFPNATTVVRESAGQVRISFQAYHPLGEGNTAPAEQVPFHTVDGTAEAGRDYQAIQGTISRSLDPVELVIPILNRPEPGPDPG
jgi:hypothetical protein